MPRPNPRTGASLQKSLSLKGVFFIPIIFFGSKVALPSSPTKPRKLQYGLIDIFSFLISSYQNVIHLS